MLAPMLPALSLSQALNTQSNDQARLAASSWDLVQELGS